MPLHKQRQSLKNESLKLYSNVNWDYTSSDQYQMHLEQH